jgi:hypothetical protein
MKKCLDEKAEGVAAAVDTDLFGLPVLASGPVRDLATPRTSGVSAGEILSTHERERGGRWGMIMTNPGRRTKSARGMTENVNFNV